MTTAIFVYVTAANRKEADKIARVLVEDKLAACVSVIPAISSIYRWKGRVERAKEILLVIKTARRRYRALEKRVKALHSYSVPEILAVPVAEGSPDYLQWIEDSIQA